MTNQNNIDFQKPVKFKNPLEGEGNMEFMITNYNEVTDRVYIQLICDMTFKPQELVSIKDIKNV